MQAYYEKETDIPKDHPFNFQTKNTEDLINAIKRFRVTKTLSNKEIKILIEEGRD
jgi:hypothetical protein